MRNLDLGRTFDGLLIWFSLFHLTPDDQRKALDRVLAHAAPKCAVLMTAGWAGPDATVSIGEWRGEPLYHASLAATDYETVLATEGFSVEPPLHGGEGWPILLATRS